MKRLLLAMYLGCTGYAYSEPDKQLIEYIELIAKNSPLFSENISQGELETALKGQVQSISACDAKGKNLNSNEFNWILVYSEPVHVTFFVCEGRENVHVHLYRMKNQNILFLVGTEKGIHGNAWEFESIIYDVEGRSFSKISRKSIGLVPPRDNEFLSTKAALKQVDNKLAVFSMGNDGIIASHPLTWMDKRWENRSPTYHIQFEWNGQKFVKVRKNAP